MRPEDVDAIRRDVERQVQSFVDTYGSDSTTRMVITGLAQYFYLTLNNIRLQLQNEVGQQTIDVLTRISTRLTRSDLVKLFRVP